MFTKKIRKTFKNARKHFTHQILGLVILTISLPVLVYFIQFATSLRSDASPSSPEYPYTAVEDTVIVQALNDKNFGTLETLPIGKSQDNLSIALLRFQAPYGTLVSSATLRLKPVDPSATTTEIYAIPQSTSWDESSATFKDIVKERGELIGTIDNSKTDASGYVTADLSDYLQAHNDIKVDLALFLKESNVKVEYYSKESSGNEPKLNIMKTPEALGDDPTIFVTAPYGIQYDAQNNEYRIYVEYYADLPLNGTYPANYPPGIQYQWIQTHYELTTQNFAPPTLTQGSDVVWDCTNCYFDRSIRLYNGFPYIFPRVVMSMNSTATYAPSTAILDGIKPPPIGHTPGGINRIAFFNIRFGSYNPVCVKLDPVESSGESFWQAFLDTGTTPYLKNVNFFGLDTCNTTPTPSSKVSPTPTVTTVPTNTPVPPTATITGTPTATVTPTPGFILPHNPDPADEATNVSLVPTFTWDAGLTNGQSVTYFVLLAAGDVDPGSNSIACIVASSTSTTNSCTFDPARFGSNLTSGRYSWRVLAIPSGMQSQYGPTWNFSTVSATPTPTVTPTFTPTVTPTFTPTVTPTNTPTNTPTFTPTPTVTPTFTPTVTPTFTPTPTVRPTNTPTSAPTNTPTSVPTSTYTPTPTVDVCSGVTQCIPNDGCCPATCNVNNDSDCQLTCQNFSCSSCSTQAAPAPSASDSPLTSAFKWIVMFFTVGEDENGDGGFGLGSLNLFDESESVLTNPSCSICCPSLPTSTPTNTPTNTPVPPTATPTVTPTFTPTVTPTSTPVPPTNTPIPPTNTPVPPTNTPVPPTATSTLTPTQRPPSPTPTISLTCNTSCFNNLDCSPQEVCYKPDPNYLTGVCRNFSCTLETDCTCSPAPESIESSESFFEAVGSFFRRLFGL